VAAGAAAGPDAGATSAADQRPTAAAHQPTAARLPFVFVIGLAGEASATYAAGGEAPTTDAAGGEASTTDAAAVPIKSIYPCIAQSWSAAAATTTTPTAARGFGQQHWVEGATWHRRQPKSFKLAVPATDLGRPDRIE
jgi:hypothetical protein